MSQHDFQVDSGDGFKVRADINAAIQALASNNAGLTEPPTKFAGMWWLDTSSVRMMKQRDSTNTKWLDRFPLDLDVSPPSSNRQKLINGTGEINQRAVTSVGDDQYFCDRWYVLTETGVVTYAQVEDPEPGAPWAIRLTQPDATAKRFGLAQIVESKDIRMLSSVAINLSARIKTSSSGNVRYAIIEHTGTKDVVTSDVVNNWASTNFTAGNFFINGVPILKTGVVTPGSGVYGDLSEWIACGAAMNNVIVFVWTEAVQAQGASLEVNRVQLEPGVIKTPFEWRDDELNRSLRYYEKGTLYYESFAPSGTTAIVGVGSIFKVIKRDIPSLVLGTFTNLQGAGVGNTRSISTSFILRYCIASIVGQVTAYENWAAPAEL